MKLKFLSIITLALTLCTSCSDDSTSDGFLDGNPDAVARYITSITVVSAQDASDNTTITVNYDDANRVTSISDGIDSGILAYNNGDLANVASSGDTFAIEELYESPYDAFDTGEVINYNNDGNPVNLRFFESEYDWNTNSDITEEYRAEIQYDNQPNPYFYTIQAAGGIEVMDNVDLNFSANPDAPQIVQARMLFPSKNIKKIIYRDLEGNVLSEVTADFVYNSDNYPTSGTITATDFDEFDGETTSIYSLTFTYQASN
ncbi:hypothetical protein SAMN04515667_0657 [Formosa sp. Hel1_31_208]|uniref:hypothetical protein n=1 Tax=Formosa sp. Hel1_31_208 TaxID=1798225 RepID=UPI00087D22DE|nr:hypothetical protein [Formosa sp. Hel1_31_208]SDR78562.1 hypothetical protein SAMN04515667_0657 [Formosa sp. Hel1_31_208]